MIFFWTSPRFPYLADTALERRFSMALFLEIPLWTQDRRLALPGSPDAPLELPGGQH